MTRRINAASPFVDIIKRLNTSLGVVKDLHGNVYYPATQNIPTSSKRGWYFIKIPYERTLSLSEIYERASVSTDVGFLPITEEGYSNLGSISEDVGLREAVLLVAGVKTQSSTKIALSIDSNYTDLTAYLNNTKLKEASDVIDLNGITLQSGVTNLLQVLISRKRKQGTFTVNFLSGSINISSDSSVVINLPSPDVVEWNDAAPIIYGSLDSEVQSNGMILTWKKSPFVGGWTIEKSTYESLGNIISYTASGTTGYDFVVSGSYTPSDDVPVIINESFVGTVTEYTSLGGNQTSINVLSPVTSGNWVSYKLYGYKDTSVIAEVEKKNTNPNELQARFIDTNVVEKMPYTYVIYSWGIFDQNILSDSSTPATALAYDATPPGPIVLWPTEATSVSVDGDIVRVEHIYPEDPDLAGYRIYTNSGVEMVMDLRRGNEFMILENAVSLQDVIPEPTRFGVFKFRVQEQEGFDTERVITHYLVTTYDYAGNELPISSGTYIPFTLLVDLPENFTAYDNLVSPTKAQRKPDTIPDHLWRTAIDTLESNIIKAGGN